MSRRIVAPTTVPRIVPGAGPSPSTGPAFTAPSLIDDRDRGWITTLCTAAALGAGKPWRTLHAQLATLASKIEDPRARRPRAVAAVVSAIRQVVTSRGSRATAKAIRALVLGSPALDADARARRIASAATQLGHKPHAIDELMWSDLSKERIVDLGEAEVDPFEVGAAANLDLIARVLRRALHVELVAHGDPRPFARVIARRGLLARITRDVPGATRFSIVGPLALFHVTSIYGRALAGIVPHLAALPRWTLVVHLDYGSGPGTVTIASPVELPRAPASTSGSPLAARLAGQGLLVDPEPAPRWSGDRMLVPDLCVGDRPVEVLAFATDEYLADKRAAYAAIGASPIFIVRRPRKGDEASARQGDEAERDDLATVLELLDREEQPASRRSRTRAASAPRPSRAP